ncbi:MAG: hypothetical protein ABIJ48_07105 [Actinomycetota bacterium]
MRWCTIGLKDRQRQVPWWRDDRGAALALVAFLGMALVLVAAVVAIRGVRQLGSVASDARWQQALYVAESGLDEGMRAIEADPEFNTGEVAPEFGDRGAERAWVVAAAEARPAGQVGSTPEGEYVVVKPANADTLYAVGFAPARDGAQRRVRVAMMTLEPEMVPVAWQVEFAFLTGGKLRFWGSAETIDLTGSDAASIHANGILEILKPENVDGCASSSTTHIAPYGACEGSPLDPVGIPHIDPRVMYPYAQVVLCPDGLAYGGPQHPNDSFKDPTPDTPCEADEHQVPAQGWTSSLSGGVRIWRPGNTGGVYYVAGGTVDGKIGNDKDGTVVQATIVIESLDAGGECGSNSGHFFLSDNSYLEADPGMSGIAIVTGGDIYYRGGATVVGALLAHEQIDFKGNATSKGVIVAESWCDHPLSPVHSSIMSGNYTLQYPGPLWTLFTVLGEGENLTFGSWDEL